MENCIVCDKRIHKSNIVLSGEVFQKNYILVSRSNDFCNDSKEIYKNNEFSRPAGGPPKVYYRLDVKSSIPPATIRHVIQDGVRPTPAYSSDETFFLDRVTVRISNQRKMIIDFGKKAKEKKTFYTEQDI